MITIQDVLNSDVFQKYTILAGRNGLSREVTTITIAEVPDAANWLRGGELVCTTAYFISNTDLEQEKWIESLILNGAAALAIKTSRFLGVLPENVIKCANNYNFPIIELDHKVTWPIVIESFMNFLTDRRIKVMNSSGEGKKNLALIDDIIHGRIHTQIMLDYDFLNINLTDPMFAILVDYAETDFENNNSWDRTEKLITITIKKYLNKHFTQVIIGNNISLFTLLVSFQPNQKNQVISLGKEAMTNALEELTAQLGKNKFRVGIGNAYPQLEMAGKSFKEAYTALSVIKKYHRRKGNLLLFEEIGIHRIFSMLQNTDKVKEFSEDFLQELKKYDEENGNENILLNTLHEYLLADCSIKLTAEKMYVHPNTISYRIKKIKQIIKHDIDNPEFKMAYLFALEANELLK